jgi:hypothetical protein
MRPPSKNDTAAPGTETAMRENIQSACGSSSEPQASVKAYPRHDDIERLHAVRSFQWDATDADELAEVRHLSGRIKEGGAS